MLHMKRSAVCLIGIILLMAGCSGGGTPEVFSTLTIAPPLNPYQSTTRTPEPPTETVTLPTTKPLIPTATPFKHKIQPGDTLYSLAIQYNISLDQLVLANPGVDTSILSIGTELIIPRSEEDQETVPTPTPYPLVKEEPVCYLMEDGGMWCYQMVENDQEIALENISMAFNLFSADQELVESFVAIPPLNMLFPGQSIPVGTYIETPPDRYQITSSPLTAFPADQQAPAVVIADYSVEYTQENQIARISGTYEITDPDFAAEEVWIAGIAFSDSNPAGLRKWISSEELAAETSLPFEFQIYSLGPRIDRVQLLVELH